MVKTSNNKKLTELILAFFEADGIEKLAKAQAIAIVQEQVKQKMIERTRQLIEKYSFFDDRISKGITLNSEDQREYDYVKYVVDSYLKLDKNGKDI